LFSGSDELNRRAMAPAGACLEEENALAADPYQNLGVKRDFSQEEIQKAYRRLAKKLHPDLTVETENARAGNTASFCRRRTKQWHGFRAPQSSSRNRRCTNQMP
jgi:DnaJ domain